MERTLSTERLYFLGDFKNLKFGNTLTGIPDELAQNDKVVSLLFFQQALSCEIAYREYVQMIEHINENFYVERGGKKIADPEAIMNFLQQQRSQTLDELYEELKNSKEPNKETE